MALFSATTGSSNGMLAKSRRNTPTRPSFAPVPPPAENVTTISLVPSPSASASSRYAQRTPAGQISSRRPPISSRRPAGLPSSSRNWYSTARRSGNSSSFSGAVRFGLVGAESVSSGSVSGPGTVGSGLVSVRPVSIACVCCSFKIGARFLSSSVHPAMTATASKAAANGNRPFPPKWSSSSFVVHAKVLPLWTMAPGKKFGRKQSVFFPIDNFCGRNL